MKYDSIQLLRYLAALLVVISHATQMAYQRILEQSGSNYWHEGTFGVDIFFVISGFVMVVSSRAGTAQAQAPKQFVLRRLVRIVPMYWLALALKVISVLLLPALALRTTLDWQHVFASFIFLPMMSPWGEITSVLPVGWTLNLEMLFYVFFAISLIIGRYFIVVLSLGFLCIFIASHYIESDQLIFWSQSIVLEFLFGALLAFNRNLLARVPVWFALLVLISAIVKVFIIPITGIQILETGIRGIDWGIAAVLVVASVIVMDKMSYFNILSKRYAILGDASYSMYLYHTFMLPLIGVVLVKVGFLSFSFAVIISVISSTIMALILYKHIEKPITQKLRHLINA